MPPAHPLDALGASSSLDSTSSTLNSPPRPPVPSGLSGGSVGASGRRSSSPVVSTGFSDGLAGSVVVSVSVGWSRDTLRALALVVGGWLPWSRVASASSGSRTVSSALPSLACGAYSPLSDVLGGTSGVVVVASSSDVSTRLVSSSTRSCARRSSLAISPLSTSSSGGSCDSSAGHVGSAHVAYGSAVSAVMWLSTCWVVVGGSCGMAGV